MPSPFVGQVDELGSLNHWLTETFAGQPRLVFVSGEAGVGKTRLIEEFIKKAKATEPSLVCAIGYCNSYFGRLDPLLPLRAVLAQLFGNVDDKSCPSSVGRFTKKAGTILMDIAPDLVGAFIPLAGPALKVAKMAGKALLSRESLLTRDDPSVRATLFDQFSRLLFWVSQEAPLLIVLEDLHWADESTVEFLFHFARSWKTQRLMLVGTYRAHEVAAAIPEHPLLQVERELERYDLCRQLPLGWLDVSSLREWVAQLYPTNQFPPEFVSWLHEQTEGNALFVDEILKDLKERDTIFQADGETWMLSSQVKGPSYLPTSVVAVLDQRIARLEKRLRDMLMCASVEGKDFTAQVISTVQQLDDNQVINSLIEVLGHRMDLVSMKEERQITQRQWLTLFEFRHSLMQEHLYSILESPQKRRLHQKIGECLEVLYEGMTESIASVLALHFSEAKDAERTLRYALLAATHAETVYDYDTARQWLKLAADHLPSTKPDPKMQADVWHRLGRAEAFTESFKKAELCYRRGLDYLQKTQSDGKKADVLSDLGFCYIQTDRSHEAISLLENSLVLNQRSGRITQAAYNMAYLAFAHHKRARQDLAKEYLFSANNQFDMLGDMKGQAFVNRHLGIHYRVEGNFELSISHLEKAANLDRQKGDKFREAYDYTNLGTTYLVLGDDEVQAMAYYQRSLELSRQISAVHEEAHVLINMARLFALQGEWLQAFQSVEEGLKLAEIVQETYNIIRGRQYRGIIEFHLGHLDGAIGDYRRILGMGAYEAQVRWGVLFNLGSLQREAGMIGDALRAYREAAEFILDIAEEIPNEQRVVFLKMQQKIRVFQVLTTTAEQMGQSEAANSLLFRLPSGVLTETHESLPRFYWGEGKWI